MSFSVWEGIFGCLAIILMMCAALAGIVMPVGAFIENRALVLRNVDRNVSMLPLTCSVVGLVAVVLAPVGTLRSRIIWCWVPLGVEALVLLLLGVYWQVSGLRHQAQQQRLARQADEAHGETSSRTARRAVQDVPS